MNYTGIFIRQLFIRIVFILFLVSSFEAKPVGAMSVAASIAHIITPVYARIKTLS